MEIAFQLFSSFQLERLLLAVSLTNERTNVWSVQLESLSTNTPASWFNNDWRTDVMCSVLQSTERYRAIVPPWLKDSNLKSMRTPRCIPGIISTRRRMHSWRTLISPITVSFQCLYTLVIRCLLVTLSNQMPNTTRILLYNIISIRKFAL